MEEVFNENYSNIYDLINKDKDYQKETNYINELIQNHRKNAKSILDLGCGTGIHDELLYDKGYEMCGVDMSPKMLQIAKKRIRSRGKKIDLVCSDITKLDLNKKYDVVISLFHVMSYQNNNEKILKAFSTAKKHLKANGIFIFDFWYGPGVISDKPFTRIKRVENENIKCLRLSESTMCSETNCVDVSFEMYVSSKTNDSKVDITKETHRMRYFFDPELKLISDLSEFKLMKRYKWLTFDKPDFSTWNAVWILENK